MASPGTAISMLESSSLMAAQLLFGDENSNQFLVQKIFGPFVQYTKKNFILDIVENLRTLGTTWHGAPSPADPIELEAYSRRLFKALYKSVVKTFSDADYTELRDVLMMEPSSVPPSLQNSADHEAADMARQLAGAFLYLKRMYEKLCINALTQASFTANIDGANATIADFGVTVNPVLVSWATATTNIPGDLARHLAAAKKQFGGPPAMMLVGSDFRSDYILDNDYAEPFFKINPQWSNPAIANSLGLEYMAPAGSSYEVVEIMDQSGAEGSETALWPATRITILGPRYAQALRNCTIISPDNDFNGGFYSYPVPKLNPIATDVVSNIYAVPAILDRTQVYNIDVETTP